MIKCEVKILGFEYGFLHHFRNNGEVMAFVFGCRECCHAAGINIEYIKIDGQLVEEIS